MEEYIIIAFVAAVLAAIVFSTNTLSLYFRANYAMDKAHPTFQYINFANGNEIQMVVVARGDRFYGS